MKNAVLSRHRRLLALCGLSAALHLLVLQLAARHGAAKPAEKPGGAPLLVRLGPAVTAGAAGPAAPPAPPPSPPAVRRAPAARTPIVPPSPMPSADSIWPAPAPLAAQSAPDAASASSNVEGIRPHYQIKPPAATRLIYRISTGKGDGAPRGAAFLDWRPDGSTYSLEMNGVLGRRSSSGVVGDDGIMPGRIADPDGREAPDQAGALDAAAFWVWLASIGNGAAGQLRGGISADIADANGVHPLSFEVVGEEEVETGVGPLRAWHLAQYARPGETRVDAWLAPEQGWLPVQLRVTRADGSVTTQVLQRKEAAGAP
jgi:hypothetical protein